jgi:hypothetical protein
MKNYLGKVFPLLPSGHTGCVKIKEFQNNKSGGGMAGEVQNPVKLPYDLFLGVAFSSFSFLSRGSHQEDERSRVYLFRGNCDVKPYPVIRGPDKDFSMCSLPLWEPVAAERGASFAAGSITETQAGSISGQSAWAACPVGMTCFFSPLRL